MRVLCARLSVVSVLSSLTPPHPPFYLPNALSPLPHTPWRRKAGLDSVDCEVEELGWWPFLMHAFTHSRTLARMR